MEKVLNIKCAFTGFMKPFSSEGDKCYCMDHAGTVDKDILFPVPHISRIQGKQDVKY